MFHHRGRGVNMIELPLVPCSRAQVLAVLLKCPGISHATSPLFNVFSTFGTQTKIPPALSISSHRLGYSHSDVDEDDGNFVVDNEDNRYSDGYRADKEAENYEDVEQDKDYKLIL